MTMILFRPLFLRYEYILDENAPANQPQWAWWVCHLIDSCMLSIALSNLIWSIPRFSLSMHAIHAVNAVV